MTQLLADDTITQYKLNLVRGVADTVTVLSLPASLITNNVFQCSQSHNSIIITDILLFAVRQPNRH